MVVQTVGRITVSGTHGTSGDFGRGAGIAVVRRDFSWPHRASVPSVLSGCSVALLWCRVVDLDELDFDHRQRLLRLVVEEVRVKGWDVEIRLRIPLDDPSPQPRPSDQANPSQPPAPDHEPMLSSQDRLRSGGGHAIDVEAYILVGDGFIDERMNAHQAVVPPRGRITFDITTQVLEKRNKAQQQRLDLGSRRRRIPSESMAVRVRGRVSWRTEEGTPDIATIPQHQVGVSTDGSIRASVAE